MEVMHHTQLKAAAGGDTLPCDRRCYSSCTNLQRHPTRIWLRRVAMTETYPIPKTFKLSSNRNRQSMRAIVDSSCSDAIHNNDPLSSTILLNATANNHTFIEKINAYIQFTGPYVIAATILGVTSVSLLAAQSFQDVSLQFILQVVCALIPTALMNIYVTTINEVMDVEIDKINKPSKPLASGVLPLNTGISLSICSAALSLALGAMVGSKILMGALIYGFVFGSGYSFELPLMRWKKWGLAAALSISVYRIFAVHICTFLHIQAFVLKRAASLNRPILFLSAYTCIVAVALSLIKDIPDIEGDKAHGMKTFAVELGPERVYWFSISLLLAGYGTAILIGLTSKFMWARVGMIIGHVIVASLLWRHATNIDPKDTKTVFRTYKFIWKLIYAELFLVQFAR